MELSTITDAFDRVAKKQKLSSSKTQEMIEKVALEIESMSIKMQLIDATGSCNLKQLFNDLKSKLNEMSLIQQLEASQKDLNIVLSKYTKFLEKHFGSDITKAYFTQADFDVSTINQIIATHFYRQGQFDLGDCFSNESSTEPSTLKPSFVEMYRILDAMKSGNFEPALSWAATHSENLLKNGWNLELKLHQLQFVEILKKGNRNEALDYARKYLAPFASVHELEIQKLMASLLWVGRLDQSPYIGDEFMSPSESKITEELTQQFCSLLGYSYESPLTVALTAGFQGLPTLLKLASVMASTNKQQDWQAMTQLPVHIELGREFQFHSIVVCPVLKEPVSEENPPMLMPCGHVASKQAVVKLSKSSTRSFKCPYCPMEANAGQCQQLHF